MTFSEKLREARKKSGLSQEQLAQKLNLSRAAVAKWETDRGMPDVENLKALSRLLNVSVDYLLEDGDSVDINEIKEPIDLKSVEVGCYRSKADAVVAGRYPDADIYPLIRKKKLSTAEWILDFITVPGVFHAADSFNDMSSYYLVEQDGRQFFVNVTEDFIISREVAHPITKDKFEIGKNRFVRAVYKVEPNK